MYTTFSEPVEGLWKGIRVYVRGQPVLRTFAMGAPPQTVYLCYGHHGPQRHLVLEEGDEIQRWWMVTQLQRWGEALRDIAHRQSRDRRIAKRAARRDQRSTQG